MTDKYDYQPDPVFANTDMSNEELGAMVRAMLTYTRPGEWVNVTMGDCRINDGPRQAVAPVEHLGTISRT